MNSDNSAFEHAYELFIHLHRHNRKGESKNRLTAGLGHAEKIFLSNVWWPAFENFNGLHPEYEVKDFKDGVRFLDFAYIQGTMKLCVEIDGYGTHWRDPGRWQFADQLMRQNHLVIDGWLVLRFAYDDLAEKPRRCQQVLQQLLGKWHGGGAIFSGNPDGHNGEGNLTTQKFNSMERDIIRLTLKDGSVSAGRASQMIGLSVDKTRRILHTLKSKGVLVPSNPTQTRTHFYELSKNVDFRIF